MSQPVAHEAIILRTRAYGESDLIVTFLTDVAGKLTGIAKGAKNSRRRFPNCLHPLSRVRAHYRQRPQATLVFLESCDLVRPATTFSEPRKLAYGQYLLELVDVLSEEAHPIPEQFHLLDRALSVLLQGPATATFLRAFELQLLCLAGYEPQFTLCKGCGQPIEAQEVALFAFDLARPLCPACGLSGGSDAVRVAAATLSALERLKSISLSEAQRNDLLQASRTEAADIVARLLSPHLRRPLASLELIAQLGRADS